jgi:hypothetical protein
MFAIIAYGYESTHEETNEEATGKKSCPALHEELTPSTDGPYDNLNRYPSIWTKLLTWKRKKSLVS